MTATWAASKATVALPAAEDVPVVLLVLPDCPPLGVDEESPVLDVDGEGPPVPDVVPSLDELLLSPGGVVPPVFVVAALPIALEEVL
ncbi:MAG: hypothetical protein ABSC94_13045 [Polyangiaceae bacterium]